MGDRRPPRGRRWPWAAHPWGKGRASSRRGWTGRRWASTAGTSIPHAVRWAVVGVSGSGSSPARGCHRQGSGLRRSRPEALATRGRPPEEGARCPDATTRVVRDHAGQLHGAGAHPVLATLPAVSCPRLPGNGFWRRSAASKFHRQGGPDSGRGSSTHALKRTAADSGV
jgi:hypothetical protein